MREAFADHFSRDSRSYARFRPRYPDVLFDWLAALPSQRRVGWDAGTGSGQAASMLRSRFDRVIASDPSLSQLRAAAPGSGVRYFAATAESSALRRASVDLVTVAQAFHWLDHPRFFAELNRILAPGGAVAVWCYATLVAGSAIDAVITPFYRQTVGPFWPYERRHVDLGYRHFEIPIEEVVMPAMAIHGALSLDDFLGYVRTWSAVGRFIEVKGYDPVEALKDELGSVWGDPETLRPITWPISMRAGRWVGNVA